MTCWLCHGAGDPGTGEPLLGLPGTRFDYGLLLATAAVLDDANAAARAARGFPSGRAVRARLLLAGPGRQDLTGEFGLDVTVPFHSARYAGTRRVRQGTKGLVNPLSVPGIVAAPGLALENWSGSENADAPWLPRLVALARRPEAEVIEALGLGAPDPALARRALLLDLRNLGTLGLQQDSFPGLLWADALAGRAAPPPEAVIEIPRMYATVAVRRAIADSATAVTRPKIDLARVARGRALFVERVVGEIANRQILTLAPRAFAAARLAGPSSRPSIRRGRSKRSSRCAARTATTPPRSIGRCPSPRTRRRSGAARTATSRTRSCRAWAPPERASSSRATPAPTIRLVPLRSLPVPAAADAEVAYCARCHARHRALGPWSSRTAASSPSTPTATATRSSTPTRTRTRAASAPSRSWPSTCRARSGRSASSCPSSARTRRSR